MESSGFTVGAFTVKIRDGRTITSEDPEFRTKLPVTAHLIDQIGEAGDLNAVLSAFIAAVGGLENSKFPLS